VREEKRREEKRREEKRREGKGRFGIDFIYLFKINCLHLC